VEVGLRAKLRFEISSRPPPASNENEVRHATDLHRKSMPKNITVIYKVIKYIAPVLLWVKTGTRVCGFNRDTSQNQIEKYIKKGRF